MRKKTTVIIAVIWIFGCVMLTGCFSVGQSGRDLESEPLVVSILGDSISTFEGYIPEADGINLKHTTRYPQEDLVMTVEETWWMQVIEALNSVYDSGAVYNGACLGINDSWSASMVFNDLEENAGSFGPDSCMASMTRIQNLGSNGTPDLILFYGGTNDVLHLVPLGVFEPAVEGGPNVAAKIGNVDLTTTKWTTFAKAYEAAILRLRHCYPNAQLLVMLPTYADEKYYTAEELEQYNAVMKDICEYYGISYVDLRKTITTTQLLPDGIHPGYEGMDLISEAVMTELRECDIIF